MQKSHIEHDHEIQGPKQQLINCMLQRAKSENTPIRQIFDEESENHEIAVHLDFATIEQQLIKARRSSRPVLPSSIEEFEEAIASSQYGTIDGSPFFRRLITTSNGQSAAIFFSNEVEGRLRSATNIHFDGTFKTCPRMFKQHFVIFFKHFEIVFPACFILMTGKSQELYTMVFTLLRDQYSLQPLSIMSDWESGSRNAARIVWPMSTIRGCFFHYTSAVQKRLKRLQLSREIGNEASKRTILRILCLPLLPADKIHHAFRLISQSNQSAMLDPWIGYIERTWMGRVSQSAQTS